MINKIANCIADFVCDKKMIMNVLFWFMVMK